jgi:hypothetical protein
VPGPVTFVWMDGAGHDVKRRDDEIADIVTGWLRGRPRG